jgi:hypothetical protein
MKIVKNDKPKEIILTELQKKIAIDFITKHNARIRKLKN